MHSLSDAFLCSVSVPFVVVNKYRDELADRGSPSESNSVEARVVNEYFQKSQKLVFIVGVVLAILYAIPIFFSFLRHFAGRATNPVVVLQHLMATSCTRAETRLKWAATRKLNRVLTNAHSLHKRGRSPLLPQGRRSTSPQRNAVESESDQTIRNYVLRGEREEFAGGIFWTWRRIIDGSLFDTEGIWLNTRLLVFQAAQVIIGAVVAFVLISSVNHIADQAAEAIDKLDPDLPDWVQELVPTPQMVYIALYPASIVATIVMVLLIVLYIPR
jgi:hypothetical protein